MKKYLFLVLLLIIPINVFASTNTNVRTENNYLVGDYITVDESNKADILSTPSVNENEKVYDFSGALDDYFENSIYERIIDYIENTNIDLVVLSSNDLANKSLENYVRDFYLYNKFGLGESRDCIILFINNNTLYLYGFGNISSHYEDISKCIYKDNSNNDNVFSVLSTISSLRFYYKDNIIKDNNNNNNSSNFNNNESINTNNIFLVICFIVSLVTTSAIMIGLFLSSKLVIPDNGASNSLDRKTSKTHMISDRVIGHHTSKSKKMNSNKD